MDRSIDSTPWLQPLTSMSSWFTKYLFTLSLVFIIQGLTIQPLMAEADPSLAQQRELYQKAKSALRVKNQTGFKHAIRQMGDYPLKHYLEAMELFEKINNYPRHDIRTYLKQHDGTPIAARLRYRWLEALRHRDRWQDYIQDYKAGSATTSQQCYYQLARIRHGEEADKTQAIDQGLKLWSVGKSQPKACDKLFGILIKYNHITEDIAWQRYTKTLFNHKFQLARYLKRFFKTPDYQALAERFYNIARNRPSVDDDKFFSQHSDKVTDKDIHTLITQSLRQQARTDAVKALTRWGRYRQTGGFSAVQVDRIVTSLVKGLFDQDHIASADLYLNGNLKVIDPSLLEWRARKAMATANWPEVLQWIAKMPVELQENDRWKYWTYRASQLANISVADSDMNSTKDTYDRLSIDRSFYGFLSSEWLGNGYSMAHQKTTVTEQQLSAIEQQKGIVLTRELLHQKEYLYARREWRAATRNFDQQQWIAAAHVVKQWGWHNGVITSMISAKYWDDVDLRFPLAFQQQFETNARETGVPVHLLYAVARQESALSHDVTSPAGAKGLMQLMPATAKQTARKNKISYHNSNDLFKPDTNIKLGSRYYSEMLQRFNNNRILASAAYNAGPHRVDRWLKKSEGKLPFDAWIETIPFKETRNYVQNVLAFSMIYAHHLGNHERILSAPEKNQRL